MVASTEFLAYLDECVTTTEQCSQSLASSISALEPGISDLPRLSKVLRNKHHFLVLPQPTVQAHKSLLSHALAPQIDNLISKAESSIDAQRAKIQRLEERLAILQQSRSAPKAETPIETEVDDENDMEDQLGTINPKELNIAQSKKVAILRGRRRRLEAERARLGL